MLIPRIQQISKIYVLAIAFCALALTLPPARAESPFIDQIPSGVTSDVPPNFGSFFNHGTTPAVVPAPQFAAPHLSNLNLVTTVEIGNGNNVSQMQNGTGDQSSVGILAGNNNNVGVVQNGNNLQSNLLLIGTKGMSIGVLQPNGSAPVNMAIIHVPAGTVIIPH